MTKDTVTRDYMAMQDLEKRFKTECYQLSYYNLFSLSITTRHSNQSVNER